MIRELLLDAYVPLACTGRLNHQQELLLTCHSGTGLFDDYLPVTNPRSGRLVTPATSVGFITRYGKEIRRHILIIARESVVRTPRPLYL